jgi:hypothetical protein
MTRDVRFIRVCATPIPEGGEPVPMEIDDDGKLASGVTGELMENPEAHAPAAQEAAEVEKEPVEVEVDGYLLTNPGHDSDLPNDVLCPIQNGQDDPGFDSLQSTYAANGGVTKGMEDTAQLLYGPDTASASQSTFIPTRSGGAPPGQCHDCDGGGELFACNGCGDTWHAKCALINRDAVKLGWICHCCAAKALLVLPPIEPLDGVETDGQSCQRCEKPDNKRMIECDRCLQWCHFSCVHVVNLKARTKTERSWICPDCGTEFLQLLRSDEFLDPPTAFPRASSPTPGAEPVGTPLTSTQSPLHPPTAFSRPRASSPTPGAEPPTARTLQYGSLDDPDKREAVSGSGSFDGEAKLEDEFPPTDIPRPASAEDEAPPIGPIDCGCGLPHDGALMVWCNGCNGMFHAHCHSVLLRQLENPHLEWFCTSDCEHKYKLARAHAPRNAKRVVRTFRGFHIVFDNVN